MILTLVKLILRRDEGDQTDRSDRFEISGIAYLPGAKRTGKYVLVSEDRNGACIGTPEPRSESLRVTLIPQPLDQWTLDPNELEGYVVHSRCWTLVEKHRDMAHLDALIEIPRSRWTDELRRTKDYPRGYSWERLPTSSPWLWPKCDPAQIQEIRSIIRKGYRSYRKQKMDPRSEPVRYLSTKYRLPLEIKYLIADFLDIDEVRDMGIALDEEFLNKFWRRHIPECILEFNDVDDDRIDWPWFAALAQTKGVRKPEGLLNRRRIMDMIKPPGAMKTEQEL